MLLLISFWLYLSVSILDLQLTWNHIIFWNIYSHTCILGTLGKPLTFILLFPSPYYECVHRTGSLLSLRESALFCFYSVRYHESYFELATSLKFIYQALPLRTLNILFSANLSHLTNSGFFFYDFHLFYIIQLRACVGPN